MKKQLIEAFSIGKQKELPLSQHYVPTDYSKLLSEIIYMNFDQETAERHYSNIIKRKEYLSKRLGKTVELVVAASHYCIEEGLFDEIILVERKLIEELSNVAIYDNLTGLYKREVFDSVLKNEIEKHKRLGKSMVLVLIDIDDFKNINDTFGHLEGDEVLKYIGSLVTQNSRLYDVECRYGGEEIAIILPEADIEEASAISERLRKNIEKNFRGKPYDVTVSLGIAQLIEEDTYTTLIKKADSALYEAKKQGKNRCCIFDNNK